jgi:aconitate hydratase
LVFGDLNDYDKIGEMDELIIENALDQVNNSEVIVKNKTRNEEYKMLLEITERQRNMIKLGGLLNLVKNKKN